MSKIAPFVYIRGDNRTNPIPVQRPKLWAFYLEQKALHWTVSEVDISKDRICFVEKLTSAEQRVIKFVLAFFANFDGIVNLALGEQISAAIPIIEVRFNYDAQRDMENTHAHMYGMLIDAILVDPRERIEIFNAIENIDVIARTKEWADAHINPEDSPFAAKVLCLACIEGLLFPLPFAVIYQFASRNLMPGLSASNAFIARDENKHFVFAISIFNACTEKLPQSKIIEIVGGAVEMADAFVGDALPVGYIGMQPRDLKIYARYIANSIFGLIGCPPQYTEFEGEPICNPFPFMKGLNIESRSNFFETRPSEYDLSTASIGRSDVDADF